MDYVEDLGLYIYTYMSPIPWDVLTALCTLWVPYVDGNLSNTRSIAKCVGIQLPNAKFISRVICTREHTTRGKLPEGLSQKELKGQRQVSNFYKNRTNNAYRGDGNSSTRRYSIP
jgi:hypothetical protein